MMCLSHVFAHLCQSCDYDHDDHTQCLCCSLSLLFMSLRGFDMAYHEGCDWVPMAADVTEIARVLRQSPHLNPPAPRHSRDTHKIR